MAAILQCRVFPLTEDEVSTLWANTTALFGHSKDIVVIRCVNEEEIRRLNLRYKKKDKPTNVLTFSYPSDPAGGERAVIEHDVAICLPVARREAAQRQITDRDYTALLITHAFLHAVGLDHEKSDAEADKTFTAEARILGQSGFSAINLSGDNMIE